MVRRKLDTQNLLARLVSFDTTSRNSNLALISFVADYLADFGVACRLSRGEDGGKANLFATIGPADRGGVVLSGHTDVVPVDGQDWESDPFATVERDGRLYGRGTADMKAFLAAALAAVPAFLARPLATPVHFAFSYDEELGCLGVPHLLRDLAATPPVPRLAIVGEPTEMRVANAAKGISDFETVVTGKEAHSSAPDRGANAIMAAARLIGFIERLGDELRENPPAGAAELDLDAPYTTVGVGLIGGGTAVNIIPGACRFHWEFRPVPGDDGDEILRRFESFAREEVLPALRAHAPEARIETRRVAWVPPLERVDDNPAEALALALTGANRTTALSFASEAGLFQRAGIPAVVCGPGSIAQAHQANEYVALEQVAACNAFMARLADRLQRA